MCVVVHSGRLATSLWLVECPIPSLLVKRSNECVPELSVSRPLWRSVVTHLSCGDPVAPPLSGRSR